MPTTAEKIRLYGIPNCDQVRAARAWLKAHGRDAELIDLRAQRLDPALLDRWLARIPWDSLVNRRGMTWRSLDPLVRAKIVDQHSAIELMLAHPLVIKRPVLEFGEKMSVGFSAPLYESLFN
jgi:arsenate reductase (glutaredoxin)